jgi:hypothetical protein
MENHKQLSFNIINKVETTLPSFLERPGRKFVEYGNDNLFPQFVASLFAKSAINRTSILSKLDGTLGKGLTTSDPTTEYTLKMANPTESWNEVLEKVALDYIMFGGWSINVIWSNDGETIAEFYHVDFSRVRSGIYNPEQDRVDKYYYAVDWSQWRKFKPLEFAAYDPKRSIEEPSQLLYGFDYEPNTIFYPLPAYAGGINDIQTDIEVSLWHINNLQNGLTPSLFIGLNNGIPDPEARQEIYDEITMSFKGAENAGKAFIAFADDAAHAPTVLPVPAANSDYYVTLETRITNRILTAHRITSPLLLGLRVEGTGFSSNADEIETSYEHFISTVIKPIQKSLLKVFNQIMYYKGYPDIELSIVPNKLFDAKIKTEAVA